MGPYFVTYSKRSHVKLPLRLMNDTMAVWTRACMIHMNCCIVDIPILVQSNFCTNGFTAIICTQSKYQTTTQQQWLNKYLKCSFYLFMENNTVFGMALSGLYDSAKSERIRSLIYIWQWDVRELKKILIVRWIPIACRPEGIVPLPLS